MGFLDENKKEEKKKLTQKDIAQKYSVIFSIEENSKININLISNTKDKSRFFIKKDIAFFSNSQKKVLKYVIESDGWKNEFDILDFWKNFEKSGFSVYFKDGKKIEKVFLSKEEPKKEEKISLKFFSAKKENFFPISEKDFVFRAKDQNFFQNFGKNILFFEQNFLYIFKDQIFIIESSEQINQILKRIIEKNYDPISGFFSQKYESKLSEKEIILINQILENSRKIFNLEENFPKKFILEESKKSHEEFLIDFDIKNQSLKIEALLDYGFKKINIADSIFEKKQKEQSFFIRKGGAFFGYQYIFDVFEDKIFYAKIDHQKEIDFYKNILGFRIDLGFDKKLNLSKKGSKQINYFLEKTFKNFKKLGYKINYTKNKLDKKLLDFSADLKIDYEQKEGNLFSFDGDFYIGKNQISLEELKNYAQKRKDYILDKEGNIVEIKNREVLEKFLDMIENFHLNTEKGKFEGKLYNAIELKNIFTSSAHYTSKFNQGFQNFLKDIEKKSKEEKISFSKKHDFLRDYQKDGVEWMSFLKKYNFGGILADDMGLGKTIQALTMIEMNIQKGKPSIVIVPKTLLGNWKEEAEKFTKNLKTILIDGSQEKRNQDIKKAKNFDLIITSYSFFQLDADKYKKENIIFNYAILDEAQYIKNFKTLNAQVVKQINADYRLALTGTPLENSLSEIWSIFEFLMPNFLESQSKFNKKYITPISKNGDMKKLKDLKTKIETFMLRRKKQDVLKELPDKNIQNLKVSLSDEQSILYQEVLENTRSEFLNNLNQKNFAKSYFNILAAITKLRLICNHPALVLEGKKHEDFSSNKLEIFKNISKEIYAENKKVLVFSQFTKMLDILEKELKKEKLNYKILTGQTKDRKKIVDEFNNFSGPCIFLISLKAGGVGLNLTSAENVILFDPWWNPSVENQAIDRAHRIGQKKKVNVYKIITKGTIEEKILLLQKKKKNLFDSLINDSQNSFKKISMEDIKNLFE